MESRKDGQRRAYQCLICLRKTGTTCIGARYRMLAHLLKTHVSLDNTPFYCSACMFQCFSEKELKHHVDGFSRHRLTLAQKNMKDDPRMLRSNKNAYEVNENDLATLSVEDSKAHFAKDNRKKSQEDLLAMAMEEFAEDDTLVMSTPPSTPRCLKPYEQTKVPSTPRTPQSIQAVRDKVQSPPIQSGTPARAGSSDVSTPSPAMPNISATIPQMPQPMFAQLASPAPLAQMQQLWMSMFGPTLGMSPPAVNRSGLHLPSQPSTSAATATAIGTQEGPTEQYVPSVASGGEIPTYKPTPKENLRKSKPATPRKVEEENLLDQLLPQETGIISRETTPKAAKQTSTPAKRKAATPEKKTPNLQKESSSSSSDSSDSSSADEDDRASRRLKSREPAWVNELRKDIKHNANNLHALNRTVTDIAQLLGNNAPERKSVGIQAGDGFCKRPLEEDQDRRNVRQRTGGDNYAENRRVTNQANNGWNHRRHNYRRY